jgi:hypothetical protein
MTVDEAIVIFSAYSFDEKKEFLAQLMYELTIVARFSYEEDGEGLTNPQRVRRVNEVQHRLSAFLGKLLREDTRRYPDELIVRMVLEHPGDDDLGQQMASAFESAHRVMTGVSVG